MRTYLWGTAIVILILLISVVAGSKWIGRAPWAEEEQGDAEAQARFRAMYVTGEDVPKDEGEVVKWLRPGAEQGNVNRQRWLGILYYKGVGVPKDEAEAAKWFYQAAEQGDERAQKILRGMGQ